MAADREPRERKHEVGGNYPLRKVWMSSDAATRSTDFIDAARLRSISNTSPWTRQCKHLAFLFRFSFQCCLEHSSRKKSIMDGTGWCPPSQRTSPMHGPLNSCRRAWRTWLTAPVGLNLNPIQQQHFVQVPSDVHIPDQINLKTKTQECLRGSCAFGFMLRAWLQPQLTLYCASLN